MNLPSFVKNLAEFGEFRIRALHLDQDVAAIHSWVNQEYAQFWGLLGSNQEKVRQTYQDLLDSGHTRVYMGFHNENPAFLLEVYEPALNPVGQHYAPQAGDLGMHILIAPPTQIISNFTYTVFKLIMEFLFQDPKVARIVVEPDHRNQKIHRLNKRVGFRHERRIELPGKSAYLAFCSRRDFYEALRIEARSPLSAEYLHENPGLAATVLEEKTWRLANRLLVRKCISEFSHERILKPQLIESGWDRDLYVLQTDKEKVHYRFRAKVLSLEHWDIEIDSIQRLVDKEEAELDAIHFILENHKTLKIRAEMLPTYLEEITSTLSGSAYKLSKKSPKVPDLLHASFQDIEMSMNEGHPAFVANNGRIGFDAKDYRAFAPEVGASINLVWLAAHRQRATFACVKDWSYEGLIHTELDLTTRDLFQKKIQDAGRKAEDYLLFPVHPWQWFHKIATIFAPEIAAKNLIFLGHGDDAYVPQQSIRTFFNAQRPGKCYVKMALSILNMGFMRGLSAYYMRTTPEINDWVHARIDADPYLRKKDFSILREVATIGYQNPYYENEDVEAGPYKKMLAALWRESPLPRMREGQNLMTMAALLHKDSDGQALLPALIQASALDSKAWLRRYMDVYLSPILHCYFQHDLVFMPHGENLILVMDQHVPVKALMKDIGEEVCLLNPREELPPDVKRIGAEVPPEIAILSIYTDLFDGFFRFMSAILREQGGFSDLEFWQLVADSIRHYQAENPQLAAKFAAHDIFRSEFHLSCWNRLQLANNQQMINLADPAANLQFAGMLKNPIAAFRESRPPVRRKQDLRVEGSQALL